jgi:hypothetical protein
MGLRRFFRGADGRHQAVSEDTKLIIANSADAKHVDQVDISTPHPRENYRGKHPNVRLREDTRFHRETLSASLGQKGLTLEIGPYFHPIVQGENVRYFDVFDSEELRNRAAADPNPIVTPETVPQMHYFNRQGDISVIPETFAEVVSSHCLEHQPDLIDHLEKVYDLLDSGGRYVALVPDKRFCFDHFSPFTAIGDILQAAAEKRTRHTLASVVHLVATGTHNYPGRHWSGDHADPDYHSAYAQRVRNALAIFEAADGDYIDCHAWRFSPDSFSEICTILFDLGRIRLRLTDVGDTREDSQEFSAVFVKD